MSPLSKRIPFALSFMLLLPLIAVVAAPPALQIHTPTISPLSPGPNDQVTVNVTVTPAASVQNVSIHYTTDNWRTTNTTIQATYDSATQIAIAHIPPQYGGGHVKYYIVAFNTNNIEFVNDNSTNYFSYTVSAPSSSVTTGFWVEVALVLAVIAAAVSVSVYTLRSKTTTH